jgi:hypothetical protein
MLNDIIGFAFLGVRLSSSAMQEYGGEGAGPKVARLADCKGPAQNCVGILRYGLMPVNAKVEA